MPVHGLHGELGRRALENEYERRTFLELEPLIKKVGVHYVVCRECNATKMLSGRQRYDIWPWLRHRKAKHDDVGSVWKGQNTMKRRRKPPSLPVDGLYVEDARAGAGDKATRLTLGVEFPSGDVVDRAVSVEAGPSSQETVRASSQDTLCSSMTRGKKRGRGRPKSVEFSPSPSSNSDSNKKFFDQDFKLPAGVKKASFTTCTRRASADFHI